MEKDKKITYLLQGGIAFLLVVIIILVILLIKSKRFINDFEMNSLINETTKIMNYYETYDSDNTNVEKGIYYALTYSNNENGINKLSSSDIKKILDQNIVNNITIEEIDKNGITPLLFENNISYNNETKEYVLTVEQLTQKELSEKSITIYLQEKVKKRHGKYIITYNKYVINNPYEILNYYNNKENSTDESNIVMNYLTGKNTNVNIVKSLISKENIDSFGKKEKSLKVTFVEKNNNLVIEEIK